MLRKCDAKEIHFRISCPPIINSCHYGIDTPNREKLLAYKKSVDEMREFLDVDTLAFQTIEGLVDATGLAKEQFCLACFNNDYPTDTPGDLDSGIVRRRLIDTSTESYDLPVFPLNP